MPIGAGRLGFWFGGVPKDDFPNPGFEEGLLGWSLILNRVHLNGGTTILGFPTPTDPTPRPVNSGGRISPGDNSLLDNLPGGQPGTGEFTANLVSDTPLPSGQANALRLESIGVFKEIGLDGTTSVDPSGGILYGPVLYSQNRVIAKPGDTVQFFWKALSGTDAGVGDGFNVYAYLIDTNNGKTVTILDENADRIGFSTQWRAANKVIGPGEAGSYNFVFVCGSFDTTFGWVVGSALIIDNVRLIKA